MVGESVIDPRAHRPDLSLDIAKFLIKACAPYRSDRFPTAQQMRESLATVRSAAR